MTSNDHSLWICNNDTYCPDADSFDSVQEFIDYCRIVFGAAPVLTQRIAGSAVEMTDATGAVVLRAVLA